MLLGWSRARWNVIRLCARRLTSERRAGQLLTFVAETVAAGLPRQAMTVANSRATRWLLIKVSATSARHSRMQSDLFPKKCKGLSRSAFHLGWAEIAAG